MVQSTVGLAAAAEAWEYMIRRALESGVRVILCTPTWDNSFYVQDEGWQALVSHAGQVRRLADRFDVGLADSFAAFGRQVTVPSDLTRLLSHINHPTREGHLLAAQEIARYFPAR